MADFLLGLGVMLLAMASGFVVGADYGYQKALKALAEKEREICQDSEN